MQEQLNKLLLFNNNENKSNWHQNSSSQDYNKCKLSNLAESTGMIESYARKINHHHQDYNLRELESILNTLNYSNVCGSQNLEQSKIKLKKADNNSNFKSEIEFLVVNPKRRDNLIINNDNKFSKISKIQENLINNYNNNNCCYNTNQTFETIFNLNNKDRCSPCLSITDSNYNLQSLNSNDLLIKNTKYNKSRTTMSSIASENPVNENLNDTHRSRYESNEDYTTTTQNFYNNNVNANNKIKIIDETCSGVEKNNQNGLLHHHTIQIQTELEPKLDEKVSINQNNSDTLSTCNSSSLIKTTNQTSSKLNNDLELNSSLFVHTKETRKDIDLGKQLAKDLIDLKSQIDSIDLNMSSGLLKTTIPIMDKTQRTHANTNHYFNSATMFHPTWDEWKRTHLNEKNQINNVKESYSNKQHNKSIDTEARDLLDNNTNQESTTTKTTKNITEESYTQKSSHQHFIDEKKFNKINKIKSILF